MLLTIESYYWPLKLAYMQFGFPRHGPMLRALSDIDLSIEGYRARSEELRSAHLERVLEYEWG